MDKPIRYYSASSLDLFERDYDAWIDRYVKGFPSPTSKEQALGRAIHFGVSAYFLGAEPEVAYSQAMEEERHNIPSEHYEAQDQIGRKLLNVYISGLGQNLKLWSMPMGLPATEFQFIAPVAGIETPLFGIMDLITVGPKGGPVIRDAKFVAKAGSQNKVLKSVQRLLYCYAAQIVLEQEVEGFVMDYVSKEDPPRIISRVTPPPTDDEIDDLLERIKKMDLEFRSFNKERGNV